MSKNLSKVFKYVAAAVFIATLAINVAITLDDPFVLLSDAMAETTTTTTTTTTTIVTNKFWKSSCGCQKGSGLNYVFCNMKTTCLTGGPQDCTAVACYTGCNCP